MESGLSPFFIFCLRHTCRLPVIWTILAKEAEFVFQIARRYRVIKPAHNRPTKRQHVEIMELTCLFILNFFFQIYQTFKIFHVWFAGDQPRLLLNMDKKNSSMTMIIETDQEGNRGILCCVCNTPLDSSKILVNGFPMPNFIFMHSNPLSIHLLKKGLKLVWRKTLPATSKVQEC